MAKSTHQCRESQRSTVEEEEEEEEEGEEEEQELVKTASLPRVRIACFFILYHLSLVAV